MSLKHITFIVLLFAFATLNITNVSAEQEEKDLQFKKRFESIQAINTSVNVVHAAGRAITSGLEDTEVKRRALEDRAGAILPPLFLEIPISIILLILNYK